MSQDAGLRRYGQQLAATQLVSGPVATALNLAGYGAITGSVLVWLLRSPSERNQVHHRTPPNRSLERTLPHLMRMRELIRRSLNYSGSLEIVKMRQT